MKSISHDQQIRIQQLERELSDAQRSNTDRISLNVKEIRVDLIDRSSMKNRRFFCLLLKNLQELLELKEREILALKEKLERVGEKHRLELDEALKAKQVGIVGSLHGHPASSSSFD